MRTCAAPQPRAPAHTVSHRLYSRTIKLVSIHLHMRRRDRIDRSWIERSIRSTVVHVHVP